MARPTDTRRRILDLTEGLLMRRGYNAFSYRDLATPLDVKTAAIHYHFPAKAQLVVAAVERYGARFDAWASLVADEPAGQRLLGYFEIGRLVVEDGRVCALAMLSSELQTLSEEVGAAVAAVQERILAFYGEALEEARAEGAVSFEGEAGDQAALVGCTLVGAQQLARALGPEVYGRVMGQQARSLGLEGPWPELDLPAVLRRMATSEARA